MGGGNPSCPVLMLHDQVQKPRVDSHERLKIALFAEERRQSGIGFRLLKLTINGFQALARHDLEFTIAHCQHNEDAALRDEVSLSLPALPQSLRVVLNFFRLGGFRDHHNNAHTGSIESLLDRTR